MNPKDYNEIQTTYSSSDSIAETLTKFSKSKNFEIRKFVAGNPRTPKEVLVSLSYDSDPEIRRQVAWNETTPLEVLYDLSNDKDDEVRRAIASRDNLPRNILTKFMNDKDTIVRNYVAEKSTSEEMLDYLADDWDYLVAWGVAVNRNVSPKTLLKMVDLKTNPDILYAIAENSKSTPEILERILSKSVCPVNDDTVQRAIRNPNITIEILDKIIADERFSVFTVMMAIDEKHKQLSLGKLSNTF
jgi:hypothetical protein